MKDAAGIIGRRVLVIGMAGSGKTPSRGVVGKDGIAYETLDLPLERAETVVVLDTPWWFCAGRAFGRGRRAEPERARSMVSDHGSHAALHVLGSKREAKELLASLSGE